MDMASTTHHKENAMNTTDVIDLSAGELPTLKYVRTQYNSSDTWRLYDYEAQTDDGYRVEINRNRDLAGEVTPWPFELRVYYSENGTGDDEKLIFDHRGTIHRLKKHAAYTIKGHRWGVANPDIIEQLRATRSTEVSA